MDIPFSNLLMSKLLCFLLFYLLQLLKTLSENYLYLTLRSLNFVYFHLNIYFRIHLTYLYLENMYPVLCQKSLWGPLYRCLFFVPECFHLCFKLLFLDDCWKPSYVSKSSSPSASSTPAISACSFAESAHSSCSSAEPTSPVIGTLLADYTSSQPVLPRPLQSALSVPSNPLLSKEEIPVWIFPLVNNLLAVTLKCSTMVNGANI